MAEDGKIVYKVVVDDKGAVEEGEKAGGKVASGFGSKLKGALGTAAKIGAAAAAAASGAIVALGGAAVKSYAEYEQLAGGVETLFKDSASSVMQYAENAYKTAGLSANQYMETVTSFSASLLQSLGGDTEKAAQVADMAITDMSDNANKMGSDMASIQAAYQGFAKGQYQLLDNLKLGYGGTKTEMERLLADAEKFSGVHYDINNLNDVYEAIHVVQTELGITGTTAKEASTTISGSLGMVKTAWGNLVTGLADPNADIGKLIGNLVESAEIALGNLIPVAEQALSGMTQLISGLAPIIAGELPGLIETVLPDVLSAALLLIETAITTLGESGPELINTGVDLCLNLIDGLIEAIPELLTAGFTIILALVDKLTEPDTLVRLIEAALTLIIALADGLMEALPELVAKAPEIVFNLVQALIEAAPKLLGAAWQLIETLAIGLTNSFGKLLDKGREIIDKIKAGFWEKVESAKDWGRELLSNLVSGITEKWDNVKSTVTGIWDKLVAPIKHSVPKEGPLKDELTWMPHMMSNLAKGVKDNAHLVTDEMERAFSGMATPLDVSMTRRDDLERNVSYAMASAGRLSDMTITVPLFLDGREIARATAWNMGEQLAWEEV